MDYLYQFTNGWMQGQSGYNLGTISESSHQPRRDENRAKLVPLSQRQLELLGGHSLSYIGNLFRLLVVQQLHGHPARSGEMERKHDPLYDGKYIRYTHITPPLDNPHVRMTPLRPLQCGYHYPCHHDSPATCFRRACAVDIDGTRRGSD